MKFYLVITLSRCSIGVDAGREGSLFTLKVAFDVECSKQCSQRSQVGHVDQDRKGLVRSANATDQTQVVFTNVFRGIDDPHKGVQHSNTSTDNELRDLHRSQYSFE